MDTSQQSFILSIPIMVHGLCVLISSSTKFEPIKPAAPVTRMVLFFNGVLISNQTALPLQSQQSCLHNCASSIPTYAGNHLIQLRIIHSIIIKSNNDFFRKLYLGAFLSMRFLSILLLPNSVNFVISTKSAFQNSFNVAHNENGMICCISVS